MLSDLPYKNIVDTERQYEVWLLRDIYEITFAEIARRYGVSTTCVTSYYDAILSLKLKYYINHLSIVHGCQDTMHFNEIRYSAEKCYYNRKYVVAYFEKEYAAILRTYRNGAPGMPERILHDLPPLQNDFSQQTISQVIELRDTKGLTYAVIGKELCMTKEKANELYNRHYFVLCRQLSRKLIEMTGDQSLIPKYLYNFRYGSRKKKYESLVKEYPELLNSIVK